MAWTAYGCRRLGLIALVMALGASTTSIVRAADVVLRVDGLACPFCAFGIEKKLMDVPAVAGMEIQLDEGKVVLELREGERLDTAALSRAVADAGFTLRKILIENAIGTLSQEGDGEFLLNCTDPLSAFRLRLAGGDAPPDAIRAQDLRVVEVTGEVTEYLSEPAPLAATSLRHIVEEVGDIQ